jgi:hypothetical protein
MNTCRVCLGTVTETTSGAFVLVGEPFLPVAPHVHIVTSTAAPRLLPLAA